MLGPFGATDILGNHLGLMLDLFGATGTRGIHLGLMLDPFGAPTFGCVLDPFDEGEAYLPLGPLRPVVPAADLQKTMFIAFWQRGFPKSFGRAPERFPQGLRTVSERFPKGS